MPKAYSVTKVITVDFIQRKMVRSEQLKNEWDVASPEEVAAEGHDSLPQSKCECHDEEFCHECDVPIEDCDCDAADCYSDNGCGDDECQECCPHDEFDHDVCMYCGFERDPGEAIDRAMDDLKDR